MSDPDDLHYSVSFDDAVAAVDDGPQGDQDVEERRVVVCFNWQLHLD